MYDCIMNEAIRSTVKEVMAARHISQRELAEQLDVNPQYIWDLLKGKSGNAPKRWEQVLEALDLELYVRPKGKSSNPIE